MVEKAKWKSLEMFYLRKYCIPRRITEVSATIDLKDAGVLIPTTSTFNSAVQPVQMTDWSWRTAVDYHKLIKWWLQL